MFLDNFWHILQIILVLRFIYSPRSIRLQQVDSCRILPDTVMNSKFIASRDLTAVNNEW